MKNKSPIASNEMPPHMTKYKLQFAYQWITQQLPRARWIVKLDDDMVARLGTLEDSVLKLYNPTRPIVTGRILVSAPVFRRDHWAEPNYAPSTYPYFPLGSCGYIVSRPIAEYVANLSPVQYYQSEDTSLGIWLDKATLANHMKPWWIYTTLFHNDGKCDDFNRLIMGHLVSPKGMRACFEKLDEWPPGKLEHKDFRYWFTGPRALPPHSFLQPSRLEHQLQDYSIGRRGLVGLPTSLLFQSLGMSVAFLDTMKKQTFFC